VERAFQGEVQPLLPVDIVPVSQRPAVRRAGGALVAVPACDSDGGEDVNDELRVTNAWRNKILDRLKVCSNRDAATIAMKALDRAERVRSKSKNLNCPGGPGEKEEKEEKAEEGGSAYS